MNAYSKDLRLKVLSAIDRGIPRKEVADLFGVSLSTIKRAYGKVPKNRGNNLTLIASMSLSGMGESMCFEGATDAKAFEVYVEHFLAPSVPVRGRL